jgi:hypothetical protein
MLKISQIAHDHRGADPANTGPQALDRLIGMTDLGRIPARLLEAFMTRLEFLTGANLVRSSRDPNAPEVKDKNDKENPRSNPILNVMRASVQMIHQQTSAALVAGATLFAPSPLLLAGPAPAAESIKTTDLTFHPSSPSQPAPVAPQFTAPAQEREAALAIGDRTITPSFKEVANGKVGPLAPLVPIPQMVVPGVMTSGLSQTFEGRAGVSMTPLPGTIGTITMEPGFTADPQRKIEVINPPSFPTLEPAPH